MNRPDVVVLVFAGIVLAVFWFVVGVFVGAWAVR